MTAAAKKQATQTPTPAPTPAPVEASPTPTKAQMTVMRLSVELAKREVTVKPEMLSMDGKFLVLKISDAWPKIVIGPGGGIDLPEIRSYPKAFEAAVIADQLYAKQQARATKPITPTAPVAKKPEAPKPEQVTPTTPKEKKEAAHQELEAKIEAAAEQQA
jgi:hypothetical protein